MKLKVASIHADSTTAGLSPRDNKRTEVFLAGCKAAMQHHPCPGCFNKDLWDPTWFPEKEVEDIFNEIRNIGNPYVTIVGGEPIDQYEALAKLLDKLWMKDYHTVVITHYTMTDIEQRYPDVLGAAQAVIDGPYIKELRCFDECETPGVYQVIGSSNQNLWYFDWDEAEWKKANLKDEAEIKKAYGC